MHRYAGITTMTVSLRKNRDGISLSKPTSPAKRIFSHASCNRTASTLGTMLQFAVVAGQCFPGQCFPDQGLADQGLADQGLADQGLADQAMGPLNQGDEKDSRPQQGDPTLRARRWWASRQHRDSCQVGNPDGEQGEAKTTEVGFGTFLPIAPHEM